MKNIILYFKTQSVFLGGLILFTSIPYIAACLYMPKIPYIQYVFLIIIACLKLIVLDEKAYSERIKESVSKSLNKELGKNPSVNEVFKRTQFQIKARDLSLAFAALIIIFSGIVFGRF